MSVKTNLVNLISHSFENRENQTDYVKRGMDKFKELKLPGETLDEFINKKVEIIIRKTDRNFFTIVSRQDFVDLVNTDGKNQLVYTPLNDHSRDKITIGSLLFSYRSGQFGSLNEALNQRGIYGLGIVLTEPFLLKEGIEMPLHTDYGVWVGYPIKLNKILSVRNIQLNPTTINLTPYNGNRNDALQYIESNKHIEALLGMILALNFELKEAFNEMKLNYGELIIPEKMWVDRFKDTNSNVFDYANRRDIIGINKLFYGAPGTGKSYNISSFIRSNGIPDFNNQENFDEVMRVTLHPEYSYSDFIGQIMPVTSDINGETLIEYKFKPGPFTTALKIAIERPNKIVFLILEELSRANVASVFGDVFQLLDRDEFGKSEYPVKNDLISSHVFKENNNKNIYIPGNLFILGTVNTSDQNVFVMDTAFKRRFEFEYIDANNIVLNDVGEPLNDYKFTLKLSDGNELNLSWIQLFITLNKFIVNRNTGLGLSEDKQLGQFFIKFIENNDDYNYNQILNKLLEYLWNDVDRATYYQRSIFSADIHSYSELYKRAKEHKNFFSEDFLSTLETDDMNGHQ